MPLVDVALNAKYEPPDWQTVGELADNLGCSRKTIYRQIWNGTLPARYTRIGRTWRVNAADFTPDGTAALLRGEAQ